MPTLNATRAEDDQRPLLVMAQDEERFGCISGHAVVRESSYVFAAVAPAQGRMTSLLMPRTTTGMKCFWSMWHRSMPGFFIVMQVDRAVCHQSKALKVSENIPVLPQPAYSPEVNPVEPIWVKLRQKHFHNRVFDSLDEVEETLSQGLLVLEADPAKLRSMTNFPHFRSYAQNAN